MKQLIVAALSAFILFIQNPQPAADSIRGTIASISQGATNAERRDAIVNRLKAARVNFEVKEFTEGTRSGANVVAPLPGKKGSPTLLLGAHLDRVNRGQGALDNAASCALLLTLIDRFKSQPLENTMLSILFFDAEEGGLIGSRAYFQSLDRSALPSKAINFDIFGYGDTLFVTSSKEDSSLLATAQQAASESGFLMRSLPIMQYPASDHRSMAQAGVETLGVALIDGKEIDSIITPGSTPPKILTLIHTPGDTIEQIREQDIAKAVPVIEKLIRLLDIN